MDKTSPKQLLFQKAHDEAKKGMKQHMEHERSKHNILLQKTKKKRAEQ